MQKQLELVELQRPGQEQRLKLLGFEAELALELGLLRELLVRLEPGRLVQLGLLKLVALRELEPIEFEPELALELLPLVALRG